MIFLPNDKRFLRVIGKGPPGVNGQPDIIRLSSPRITTNDKEFDTMEETLWVKDLNQVLVGTYRSGVTALTTDRWVVDSRKITRFLAGYPVIIVTSKGWANAKAVRWDYRRNVTGDAASFNLGGQAYVIATAFFTSLPSGTYNALTIPSERWGLINAKLTPGSFVPVTSGWGAVYKPGTNGWYLASRDVTTLADGATCKSVTTFACFMNTNGTAPV